jgi:transcriptional regulator with XRE-family HTH domain
MSKSNSLIFRKQIGANIRRFRLKKDLSQEKLAEIASLSNEYISRVERGIDNISVDSLYRIGEALETPPHLFLIPQKQKRNKSEEK